MRRGRVVGLLNLILSGWIESIGAAYDASKLDARTSNNLHPFNLGSAEIDYVGS